MSYKTLMKEQTSELVITIQFLLQLCQPTVE